MNSQQNNERVWRSAFVTVMEKYEELKSTTGQCGAFKYGTIGQESDAGNYNPRVIRATASDYIADVELAAERALGKDSTLHQYFKKHHVEQYPPPEGELTHSIENRIAIKVGKMLHRKRLHRINDYFKVVDCR